jgi:hypothetical protein
MKTLKEKEVILQNPMTGTYDVAHVVKEMEVKQYGVHTDDHDFHTSYFDAYNSKAEAENAMKKDEEWAYTMGDNKYFYVTTRTIIVRRFFDIDMAKRNSRARAKREYVTPLKRIAKAHGFDKAIELLAVGLYYPAKNEDDLPPLTENYIERADKVYFIKLKDKTEIALDLESLSKEASLKGLFVKKMLERTENAPEDEKELYKKALKLGLKAFNTEVKYDED